MFADVTYIGLCGSLGKPHKQPARQARQRQEQPQRLAAVLLAHSDAGLKFYGFVPIGVMWDYMWLYGVIWGYIRIMEKNIETSIVYIIPSVWG